MLKDMLASRVISGAMTSTVDLRSDVGMKSTGDDFIYSDSSQMIQRTYEAVSVLWLTMIRWRGRQSSRDSVSDLAFYAN